LRAFALKVNEPMKIQFGPRDGVVLSRLVFAARLSAVWARTRERARSIANRAEANRIAMNQYARDYDER
jgi:hypothetical protein